MEEAGDSGSLDCLGDHGGGRGALGFLFQRQSQWDLLMNPVWGLKQDVCLLLGPCRPPMLGLGLPTMEVGLSGRECSVRHGVWLQVQVQVQGSSPGRVAAWRCQGPRQPCLCQV